MNTDKAREIVAAHDAFERSLANVRNAAAMSSDEPRATELLERGGDSYAVAVARLEDLQREVASQVIGDGEVVDIADAVGGALSTTDAESPADGDSPQHEAGQGAPAEDKSPVS